MFTAPPPRHSLLGYAPQHVLDRVGKRGEADDDEQVGQGAAEESVVAVGLLYPGRRVGPAPKRYGASVERGETVRSPGKGAVEEAEPRAAGEPPLGGAQGD